MLVKFYGDMEELGELQIEVTTLKEVLSLIKLTYGQEVTDKLINNPCIYFLTKGDNMDEGMILTEEIITSDFAEFDTLHLIPEVNGEFPVPVILAAALASAMTSIGLGAFAGYAAAILATIGNMMFAMAANMLMQALSPTPEFKADPASGQKSGKSGNLFNGAPLIREQGGSVPLIFGNPYCGGVLISSGITNE